MPLEHKPSSIQFTVDSPHVQYTPDTIMSHYTYRDAQVLKTETGVTVVPTEKVFDFKVDRKVPKLGLMIVFLFN